MLNPFPDLLTYGLLAPFMIRIFVGGVLLLLAFRHLLRKKTAASSEAALTPPSPLTPILGVFEGVTGLALMIGFYTQLAALASVFLMAVYLASPKLRGGEISMLTLKGLLIMSLSLLLTGAGAFAFDIPL